MESGFLTLEFGFFDFGVWIFEFLILGFWSLEFGLDALADCTFVDAPRRLHIRLSAERLTTRHVEKVHCLQNLPTGG